MMITHRTQAGMVGILLALFIGGLFLVTCDEAPLAPTIHAPRDYRVWSWDLSSDREFFAYHTLTGLVDTVPIPSVYPWFGFTVSSDGSQFFVAESATTKIVDIASREVLVELPYKANGGLVASPDGRWLAVHGQPGFWVLSLPDLSVVYFDSTLTYADSWFTLDGRRLFTSGKRDTAYTIVAFETGNWSTPIETEMTGAIIRMRPSVDGGTWYLLKSTSSNRTFEAYDVERDSVTFRYWLLRGMGDMEITPDGDYIFLSEAGSYQDGTGPSNFAVFSTALNRIDRLVSTVGIVDGLNPAHLPIGEMVVTPDGRWMIGGEALGGSTFIRFNVDMMEIDDHVELTGNALGSFTCQSK